MARHVACYVWWMCQVTLMAIHAPGGSSDVVGPDTSHTDITGDSNTSWTSCGDDSCWCAGDEAHCPSPLYTGKLTYIPRLPDSITGLVLCESNLSSNTLSEYLFANLTEITWLDLSHNYISWLPRHVFEGMENLEKLDLHGNALDLQSLREIFSIHKLEHVILQNCNLPPPPADFFQNSTSNIQSIDLTSNPHCTGIYNLDAFCAFKFLNNLDLSFSFINIITSSCPLQELRQLDLTANFLGRFPKTCTGKKSIFPNLTSLILTDNRIDVLCTEDICLPSLMNLSIDLNLISHYIAGTFSSMKFPNLERVSLGGQTATTEGTIEDYAFDNENLKQLDLSDSELTFGSERNVGKYAFANCSRMQSLHLNWNSLLHVDDQRFLDLFGHMHSLKNLSMSKTMFESVSTRTFANFPNLTQLSLDNNMIAYVPDGAFDSLHRLDILLLHNNKLKAIDEHTFNKDLRENLSRLDLSFNPFTCSCDLLWFRDWYLRERFRLFDLLSNDVENKYRCQNIPGLTLANFSMTEQACLLSKEVSLLLIQFCSIYIFALILVSLLFRYRWYLRLLMYEVFRGRDVLRRQRLQANNFDFDVFVSYAADDLPWVRQHLMPKLEDELGLRLCVHERDFIPGRHIVDNIVQCVESSKKILMVFSAGFVLSPWCQFELSLCLLHVLDYDDALIVVCVDDVTSRQMTSAMMAVVKTTTYIQWREGEEDAVVSFWARLRLALNEILPHDEHYV